MLSAPSLPRLVLILRAALLLVLTASLALYVIRSRDWPIMWDTAVMHYVRFLMSHGQQPYTQITDMNMPGTYLFEGLGMRIFGTGDVGWRLYDFLLLGILIAGSISIARPYDWSAGALAGSLFALIHGSDGPMNSVERDEVMTVLLVVAYAFLFRALRRRQPAFLALFALFASLAASVKPTVVPLAVALFGLAVLVARRQRIPLARVVGWSLGGFAAATAIVLGFLLRHHSLAGFVYILRDVLPHYAGVDPAPLGRILYRILPPAIVLLLPAGLFLAIKQPTWVRWERWAMFLGVAFGAFSFLLQRKGYFYHRYTIVAFSLLWLSVELFGALRHSVLSARVAIATLLCITLFVIPLFSYRIYRTPSHDTYASLATYLESDLSALGGNQLQHQVECLDLVFGCLSALYHLGIVGNTSSTGDLLYFLPSDAPVVLHYRNLFWQSLQTRPPTIIVLSNEWYSEKDTFRKVNAWPEFASYLQQNYTVAVERTFGAEGLPLPVSPPDPRQPSYRIYVRHVPA